jgi:regulator of protease activity HflC (stomatin/prohibitin superfamily)
MDQLISTAINWALTIIVIIAAIIVLRMTFFKVSNQTVKIIERFGKYSKTARAGLNFKIPFVDSVRQVLNLQVLQHVVNVDTITKDKVSVKVAVAVQYEVIAGKEAEAVYKLSRPETQIETYVFDVVRSLVTTQDLDEVFNSKGTIAEAVNRELTEDMKGFGYSIVKALVTEIDPDAKVKEAMNNINAAQRDAQAANAKGEAEKTLRVKAAEAQRDADKLKGEGIAQQRLAIVNGLAQSVEDLKKAYPGASEDSVMSMLMMNQWLETMSHIGAKSGATTIFIPSTPQGMIDYRQQIMEGLTGAGAKKAAPQA